LSGTGRMRRGSRREGGDPVPADPGQAARVAEPGRPTARHPWRAAES